MATYADIMNALNVFLVNVNKLSPLSNDLFQGVFVKKLSNSNLISSKKYIDIATGKKTHQSHIDLTGQDTLKFFFGDHPDSDTEYSQIMIDIPSDHLKLLQQIDIPQQFTAKRGRDNKDAYVLRRQIPENFVFNHSTDLYCFAYAFKKLEGHSGDQNQINRLENKDEFFELCSSAYEGDFLVLLKHTLNHYIALLVPSEYAGALPSLLGTSANFSVNNPAFSASKSSEEFCNIMNKNVKQEFSELDSDIQTAYTGLNGHDKEQITKVRVGQGSFRKLLIEQRGCTCELCSVNLPEVLRASHIQSWSSSSPEERLDLQNGLLLCANHDALFDRHMITIDANTSELLISTSISDDQREELKLIDAKTLLLSDRMKAYMKKHNALFEK